MKTYQLFIFVPLLLCYSCFDEYANDDYHASIEYCNEIPRLLYDHHISEDGKAFIQSFIDQDELKFVPFGTAYSEDFDESVIWTWEKTKQEIDKQDQVSRDIECTGSPEQYDRTYSITRATEFSFFDITNHQTLAISIKGILDPPFMNPTGVNELLHMELQYENPHGCEIVLDFYTHHEKNYETDSELFAEMTVKDKTYTNVLTTRTTNMDNRYQFYIKKDFGIILVHDLRNDKFWEPLKKTQEDSN